MILWRPRDDDDEADVDDDDEFLNEFITNRRLFWLGEVFFEVLGLESVFVCVVRRTKSSHEENRIKIHHMEDTDLKEYHVRKGGG